MKSIFIIPIIVLFNCDVFAQSHADEVQKRLKEFKINEGWLSSNLKEEDAIHYYKVKSTTGSINGNVTSIADYDPRRKTGERTRLLSVNGNPPTKKEAKKYDKRFDRNSNDANGKIDPTSYKIIEDNDEWFVVDFRLIKESLPDHYKFLGDCEAELHCRKDIMRASYSRFRNFQPTKVKMFDADKVEIEIYFTYDDDSESYVHEEARYYIDVKIVGIASEVEVINYYSDYQIVK